MSDIHYLHLNIDGIEIFSISLATPRKTPRALRETIRNPSREGSRGCSREHEAGTTEMAGILTLGFYFSF